MLAYAEGLPVFHSDGQLDLGRSSDILRILSVHPQEASSSLRRWRGSLYRHRPYETMIDGALSWTVCRLVRDTKRFDDHRVGLSSAIARPFVLGASTVWRRVSAGSRTLKMSRRYSSKQLLLAGVFPSHRHRRLGTVERLSSVSSRSRSRRLLNYRYPHHMALKELCCCQPCRPAIRERTRYGKKSTTRLYLFRVVAAGRHVRLISSSAPTSLSLPPRPCYRWNRWQNDVIYLRRNNKPNNIIM